MTSTMIYTYDDMMAALRTATEAWWDAIGDEDSSWHRPSGMEVVESTAARWLTSDDGTHSDVIALGQKEATAAVRDWLVGLADARRYDLEAQEDVDALYAAIETAMAEVS